MTTTTRLLVAGAVAGAVTGFAVGFGFASLLWAHDGRDVPR